MAEAKFRLHVTKGYRWAPSVRCEPGEGRRAGAKRRSRESLSDGRKKDPQRIIEKMTNHERNLWARAGYPKGKKFKIYAAAALRGGG